MSFFPFPENSVAKTIIFPVVDYVARLAELILLTAVFYAAAGATGHWLLWLFAIILNMCSGCYAGVLFFPIFYVVSKIGEVKKWSAALAIALPPAIFMAWAAWQLGSLLREVVLELATNAA